MGKIVGLQFPEAEGYACPHCGRGYKSKEAMIRHLREKHGEADPETQGND